MENIAYLSLGSNLGTRDQYLKQAIQGLCASKRIKLIDFSSIYETEPVGFTEQPNFLNMVVKVETDFSPFDLLDQCLSVEKFLGRKRILRWGPRTIDLDILLYNQENIETEKLMIPHPRMLERAFVLVPLAEIDPDLKTMEGETIRVLANEISKEGVRLWRAKNGDDVSGLFEN